MIDEFVVNSRGDVVHKRHCRAGRMGDERIGLRSVFDHPQPETIEDLAKRMLGLRLWPCGVCLRNHVPWDALRRDLRRFAHDARQP